MRYSIDTPIHEISLSNPLEIDKMLLELDHLKKQSERLDLINKLHSRMAGVLSLTGMIEAYSVWLMPLVSHELIGYNNTVRNKKYLFSSGHGPNRRQAMRLAEKLIEDKSISDGNHTISNGHYAYKWIFETVEDEGVLLILKKDQQLAEHELEIINDSLLVLAESLRRGLEYDELFVRACHDPLTGLANRRVFEERIGNIMEAARRHNRSVTMISMDLDHFKSINDNLGHHMGDTALKAVADVLRATVRVTDLLVRMGGDEFLLILEDTNQKSARILAERLCVAVHNLDIRADAHTRLGISIGLSELHAGESLNQWMERTDDTLYHAKTQGKGQVAVGYANNVAVSTRVLAA